MKKFGLLLTALALFGQDAPPTVVVQSTVTASNGQLICLGIPTSVDPITKIPNLHVECRIQGYLVYVGDSRIVNELDSLEYTQSFSDGTSAISWTITKAASSSGWKMQTGPAIGSGKY